MSRSITEREADLMTQFGFRLAKGTGGNSFETVFYDQIERIYPTSDGMEVAYKAEAPMLRTFVKVKHVEIPAGKMASGEAKNLDTAWIFVYYESVEHIGGDGKPYHD